MAQGTHEFVDDPRNRDIKIYVNGDLKPRNEAVVSVFDSGFVLGDGVWEGLRVHAGRIAFLDQHLDRLYEGAKAIDMNVGLSRDELTRALYATLAANGMSDHAHVRLMVTRGVKRTPYQDPRVTVGPATVVIIAEHKEPLPAIVTEGITLFTTHVRRAAPDTLDPRLNSHSKLNDITACIQAYTAGADEALMLDPHGFVATCNSTHFFIVRKGEVWTSTGMYCLGGITRANVLRVCRENGIVAHEKSFSLTDVYGADEAFVTGTFAGVAPVVEIDGRRISDAREVLVSYLKSRPHATAEDIGVPQQADLYDEIAAVTGAAPPVIDADEFLRCPEAHLRQLCTHLGIAFTPRMLAWPAGPRDSDGIWAPYWYDAVLKSTGFEPWRERDQRVADQHRAIIDACMPAYLRLRERRLSV
jgi:branched-chain amino acid aminotransferase